MPLHVHEAADRVFPLMQAIYLPGFVDVLPAFGSIRFASDQQKRTGRDQREGMMTVEREAFLLDLIAEIPGRVPVRE